MTDVLTPNSKAFGTPTQERTGGSVAFGQHHQWIGLLMGKSARILGLEFGKTAQEMNSLLKEHGYLEGEPGAYGLTERGNRYGQEQDHHRGTGGYSHYNRYWTTRTWNDETAASLAADIEAARKQPLYEVVDDQAEGGIIANFSDDLSLGADHDDTRARLIVLGAVLGAAYVVPRLRPLWDRSVRPAARKLRDRLTRRAPESIQSSEQLDRETAVDPAQTSECIEPENAASDEETSRDGGQSGLGPRS